MKGMRFLPRRWVLYLVLAAPFVLLPAASAWSVKPLATMAAHWCRLAASGLSVDANAQPEPNARATGAGLEIGPANPPSASPGDEALPREATEPRNERSAARAPTRTRRDSGARRARPSVFVGPDSIQRAIPITGRPTSSWISGTADHPAGLLIQSPGALAGVIEPGDILVEAEGQALRTFEQLITTVRQAYERRVKRLSGRLFRKGDLVPVTVEPGW